MSVSPVLDESIFKKWNSISKLENLENFSLAGMKGPNNVSVRLDLFPEHTTRPNSMDFNADEKIKDDNSEFSNWNDTEQTNNQVVFIHPEWDEIEEEKAGMPSILNSITPNLSGDKLVPPQIIDTAVTDTESVSSVTVSLDEFAEESEEIVTVISDSDAEVIHTEIIPEMEGSTKNKLPKKTVSQFPSEDLHEQQWKEGNNIKLVAGDELPILVTQNEKSKDVSNPEGFKKRKSEPADTTKLMKASCYVMQNGKITKPFYIVKNPILREGNICKNITKSEDTGGKRSFKIYNLSTVNEEEQNLLPLDLDEMRNRENFKEPHIGKMERTQDIIKIIEHPARTKKIVINKMGESKNSLEEKKNVEKNVHRFAKDSSSDSVSSSCEGEDLMWLLDFKLDNLFGKSSVPALSKLDESLEQYSEFPGKFVDVDGSVSNFSESDVDDKIKVEIGCQTETTTSKSNKVPHRVNGTKQQHKTDMRCDRTFNDLKCSENRKPPFTYTELIECALQEKGPLTVSEIYNWISETFPYYKSWDDRWKNSVRHNLSINPYFRKGTKARQGSGHLWTVNKSDENSRINNWKRHRFHEFEEFSKRLRYGGETEKQEESMDSVFPISIMDETELATASIEDKENRRLHRDVLMAACIDNNFISTTNVSLEQSAEEILSGVKKNVEVQYLEPVKSPCEDDFLNPISKDLLMGECGLLNQIELNLTAETGETLGVVDGITDTEIFGIPDELNFHYDIPSHPPQLLPLAK